jgi:dTDP-4-dehydrorhamnose 3,5-epimerase
MKITPTAVAGVVVVESEPRRDERGTFMRLFCGQELAGILEGRSINQINWSTTREAGSLRGLHYQRAPHAETKFIRCTRGKVWDVAVDLRKGSPTFLHWHAEELDPENARMMVVPEGCAHGFQTMTPDCELLYLHTTAHAPESEGGVVWNDPQLGITWPLPLPQTGGLSDRDRELPMLGADFRGLMT